MKSAAVSGPASPFFERKGGKINERRIRIVQPLIGSPFKSCGNASYPYLRFAETATSTVHEIRPNFGNGYTKAIDPPIVIAAGDTVTVNLAYDLANTYYADVTNNAGNPPATGVLDNWYCVGAGDPKAVSLFPRVYAVLGGELVLVSPIIAI